MIKFKITISCFFLSLAVFGIGHAEQVSIQPTTPLPTVMLGTWKVTDVFFDLGKQKIRKGPDDKYFIPQYLGRIFTLTSNRLSINTSYDDTCEEPGLSAHKSTAAKIIAKSITSRLFDPTPPTPQNMQLPLENDVPVEVLYLRCKDKWHPKDRGRQISADLSNVVWFINLDNKKLAMSWHQETVLILSRVSDNTKPVASFNCAKARTAVEKTLCGSVGLAAYDQSLTQAYKLVMAYYRSTPDTISMIADLKQSQKKWLVKRDKCGTNTACLEKIMDIRIDDLIYDMSVYMSKL